MNSRSQDPVAAAPDMSTSAKWLVDAMHLGSAGLPVGGYAYSQGFEQAHECGMIHDCSSAADWIHDALLLVLARQELPYWVACHAAATERDWLTLTGLTQELCALRETAEFRLESAQMGYSVMQLFEQWQSDSDERQVTCPAIGTRAQQTRDHCDGPDTALPMVMHSMLASNYTAAHAVLAATRQMSAAMGLTVYVWSWVEAQVMAALKIVPLGQRDGQRLLHKARRWIEQAVQIAIQTPLDQAGGCAFGLAVLSARHETQYTRLFRS